MSSLLPVPSLEGKSPDEAHLKPGVQGLFGPRDSIIFEVCFKVGSRLMS